MSYVIFFLILILVYIGWGITFVRPNTAKVVERLGKFHKVLTEGRYILFLPGLVDRVTRSKNHDKEEIPVMQRFAIPVSIGTDGKPKPFDFKDGVTAAVDVKVWVQIGDPQWSERIKEKEVREKILEAVKSYVYGAYDSKQRVDSLVDDIIRPILQSKTSDQYLEERFDLKEIIDVNDLAGLNKALHGIGLWLDLHDWITVGDIDITDKFQEARERVLIARKAAEARKTEAEGIRRAAEIIARGEKGDGQGENAVNIQEGLLVQQRLAAFEAMKGGKITLVHPNIGAATAAMMDIASNK